MKITKEEYQKYVKKTETGSNVLKDCLCAFAVGGIICTFGQFLGDFYQTLGLSLETAKTTSTVTPVSYTHLRERLNAEIAPYSVGLRLPTMVITG